MLSLLNKKALLFSLYGMGLLLFTRIIILLYFGSDQQASSSDLLNLFILGFRFDIKLIASILLLFLYLPALVALYLNSHKFLRLQNSLLFLLFLILLLFSFIEFGYYLFFGNGIDILIFGLTDDGTKEVIESFLGDFRLIVLALFGTLVLSALIYMYFKRVPQSVPVTEAQSLKKEYFTLALIILLLVALARGSFGTFPLSRKTMNTQDNAFLNSLVLNPIWHFYYALHDKNESDFSTTTKKILKIAKVKSVDELKKRAGYTPKNPLKRTTAKSALLEKKPPHVIFVLKEGWSTHPALDHGEFNNILGEFAQHAKEDYLYKNFFSNAYGTNPTIENLLLNSPIKGISQSRASKISFDMSTILPFKRSGYSTLFLSGGSSSWRNHNQFWPRQGFDEYIGRSTIEKHYQVACDNPWGVYDEYLFNYLKEKLLQKQSEAQPSFTFVLTTNNHTPTRIPKEYKSPKFDLEKLGFRADDTIHEEMLRGYQYQTNAFGAFLTWLKNSPLKDDVIVVATGDHIRKGYSDYFSTKMQYLKYAVLTYFYVPKQYDRLKNSSKEVVGSHNDIFPTLYELALSHQEYYNFGTPIMYKHPDTAFGWNEQKRYLFKEGVVTPKLKMYHWQDEQMPHRYLNTTPKPLTKWESEQIQQNHNQILLKKYLLLKEYEEEH
jgi:phosphoglycerol transferase MdoB-like AlkP superfamily enzyme